MSMDERWEQGDRNPDFLMAYLSTLNATYKNERASEVADALLSDKASTFAGDATLRNIYMRNLSNPFSPAFIHSVQHPESLIATLGEEAVARKTESVLSGYQNVLVSEHDGTATMDMEKFGEFMELHSQLKVRRADHYRLQTLMTLAEKQKDLPGYLSLMQEYLANPELDADDMTLAQWIKPFMEPTADPAQKAIVRKILEQRIADIDAGKRKAMMQVGNMQLSVSTRELLQRILTMTML